MSISDTKNSECSSLSTGKKKTKYHINKLLQNIRCSFNYSRFNASSSCLASGCDGTDAAVYSAATSVPSWNPHCHFPSSSRRLRRTNPAARCRPPGRPSGRWPPRTARTGWRARKSPPRRCSPVWRSFPVPESCRRREDGRTFCTLLVSIFLLARKQSLVCGGGGDSFTVQVCCVSHTQSSFGFGSGSPHAEK